MPKTYSSAPDLASLLDVSSAGELIPELARHGLQQLIELEVAAVLGADRHESTEERLGHRNGYRPRTFTTKFGDLALQTPNCEPAASCPRSSNSVGELVYTFNVTPDTLLGDDFAPLVE